MTTKPNPIDIHVGKRLREICILEGFTQEKLGDAIGLSFQQITKYMNGGNRISMSRMYRICKTLDVPVSYFFEGLDDDTPAPLDDTMTKRETLELVRAYHAIPEDARGKVFALVKALAKEAKAGRRAELPTTQPVQQENVSGY